MAIPLTINGATFEYPQNFDENWGVNATGWAQAVTNGLLQLSGGSFPLTADVNFGPNFGLLSKYFETRSALPATTGTVRLSSADAGIAFRNNANSGNLILTTNSIDQLVYNGTPVGSGVSTVSGTANQINSTGGITPVLSLSSTLVLPGTMTAGGDIAMASHKITGLANGTVATDAVAFGQVSGQRILQIVQATTTTSFSTTSGTFQTTNLSATITCSSTSSKVRITASGDVEETDVLGNIITSLFRDSTNLADATDGMHVNQAPVNTRIPVSFSYVDSPASVSPITYSVKLKNDNGSTTVRFGISGGTATQIITLEEIG